MLGESTYWDDDKSVTPSIDATPAAVEDSGVVDIAASCSHASGGGTEPTSAGTITTSSPPARPQPMALVSLRRGRLHDRPLLLDDGGATDSATVAMASPSSTCTKSGSVYGG
jgi:hypothetical protein